MKPASPALPETLGPHDVALMVEAVDPVPKFNFKRLLALATRVVGVPMGAITTFENGRQIAPYNFGMDNPGQCVYICAFTIRGDELLIIPDTLQDPRVSQMSVVTGPPHVRFYVGAPLISPGGRRLGTLAMMDRHPRVLTQAQQEDIKTFADQVMTQLEVLHQRQELHALADNLEESHRLAHLGNWEWEKNTDAMTWSREVYSIFGRSLADPIGDSRRFLRQVHPDDRDRVRSARNGCLESGVPYQASYRIIRPDAKICCVHERAEAVRDSEGNTSGLFGYLQDMTGAWKAEQDRRESEERFRSMFEQAAVGITLTQLDGKFAQVNQRFAELLGYAPEELSQLDFQTVTHPDDLVAELPMLDRLLRGESETYTMEKRFLRKDGETRWINLTVSIRRDADGAPRQFIAVAEDIAARKRVEEDLRSQQLRAQYLASHDSLTGLPNRSLLHDRLDHAIAHAHRTKRMVAVMFLDLDRFKLINDTLGHKSGDQLLQTMGARLQEIMREGDTVARLGGDEFVILVEDLANEEEATSIAEKVLSQIAVPAALDGHQLVLSTSVGVSMYPKDSQNAHVLLKQADIAMYQAKEKGGNALRYFDPEMNSHVFHRLAIENGLRRALELDELALRYQPLVDLKTGRIVGMEALVRWNHPEKGLLGPDEFISVAEETGLIIELGECVLRKACQQQQEWQEQGLPGVRMAVNLSAKQFGPRNLVSRVRAVLNETGMDPSLLKLEITETGLMQDVARTQDALLELSAMGIELAIDDFGTGYSSLSYLKTLPIDTLKVDRSFVNDLAVDTDDAAIVSATIRLAHSLGLRVIAEGVETLTQLAFLANQRCDEGQGYYFSLPLVPGDMEDLLRAGKLFAVPAGHAG